MVVEPPGQVCRLWLGCKTGNSVHVMGTGTVGGHPPIVLGFGLQGHRLARPGSRVVVSAAGSECYPGNPDIQNSLFKDLRYSVDASSPSWGAQCAFSSWVKGMNGPALDSKKTLGPSKDINV